MQKVLTIVVPFTANWALPYGPAVVNGILKNHGYDVCIWDLSIDLHLKFSTDPDFGQFSQAMSIGGYSGGSVPIRFVKKVLRWINSQFSQQIKERHPDIVLFSIFSSQSLDLVVPLVTMARELLPNSYISIGGRGLDNIERETQTNYGEYYAKYLPLNAVYMGDAENQLIKMIESQYKGLYKAGPVNSEELSSVPPADWTGLKFEKYYGYKEGELRIPLTASKGCVRQCTFCDVAGSWPKFVFRNGQDVGQEIVNLYHKFGINKFEFTDNLVNGSISNFRAMNQVIAKQLPNTIDYLGYAICRPKNQFPESDFELTSIAGAKRFKVGIESGSEKIRFDMKKKFSNDDIDWFAKNCAKYNIDQTWLMFCGYPSETEKDFQDTLDLLDKYQEFAQQGKIKVFLSLPMMLTSNSGFMRNYAADYGLDHNYDNNWSDFFWTSTKYTENTFDVRIDRWRRFMYKIQEHGYDSDSSRQAEKFVELEGLEKIFQDYKNVKNKKHFIPITNSKLNLNQETHL